LREGKKTGGGSRGQAGPANSGTGGNKLTSSKGAENTDRGSGNLRPFTAGIGVEGGAGGQGDGSGDNENLAQANKPPHGGGGGGKGEGGGNEGGGGGGGGGDGGGGGGGGGDLSAEEITQRAKKVTEEKANQEVADKTAQETIDAAAGNCTNIRSDSPLYATCLTNKEAKDKPSNQDVQDASEGKCTNLKASSPLYATCLTNKETKDNAAAQDVKDAAEGKCTNLKAGTSLYLTCKKKETELAGEKSLVEVGGDPNEICRKAGTNCTLLWTENGINFINKTDNKCPSGYNRVVIDAPQAKDATCLKSFSTSGSQGDIYEKTTSQDIPAWQVRAFVPWKPVRLTDCVGSQVDQYPSGHFLAGYRKCKHGLK
jgi:hypothetical protein